MTGMERAHLNALTRLETAGREAADAAAEEHEKLATDFERIRSELLETTRAKETAERDAADARRDAASSAAAARSALAASAATSPPESPAREGEGGREVSDRDPVKPLLFSFSFSFPGRIFSSGLIAAAAFGASVASELRLVPGGQARGRARAQTSRGGGEARRGGGVGQRARTDGQKRRRAGGAPRARRQAQGDASEAQRERSKAEAKAWEWRRALRASEKAAKDAAGLLRRRDETQTEELKRRRLLSAEKTPANPGGRVGCRRVARALRVRNARRLARALVPRRVRSSPRLRAPRAVPGAAGGDGIRRGRLLDPKPHPSTVESARLEAEELATRRRVREETGVDVFAPFGSPPAVGPGRAGSRSTPSRRQLHLRSPHKPLAADAETASLRTECASLRIENERLASDVARWRAEASAVADQARESERSTFTREQRRLEKAHSPTPTRKIESWPRRRRLCGIRATTRWRRRGFRREPRRGSSATSSRR